MPPETKPIDPVIDLDPKPQVVQIPKQKLMIIGVVAAIVFFLSLVGVYVLSKSSASGGLEKQAKVATKASTPANVKRGVLGEEVETLTGIGVTLESAQIDQVYEEQKKDQRDYYQQYASSSAYLQSDYFNQSVLIVKVALKNKKDIATTYTPTNFRLKDSEDNQYTAGVDSEKPQIFNLNPKELSKISISFTVPTKEKEFKLIYENAQINFTIQ